MKKNAVIAIIVLVAIIVAVMFFLKDSKKAGAPESAGRGTTEDMPATGEKSAGESVIGSIKDAFSAGKKMQCTYTLDAGSQKTESTVMIDGERFRSTVKTPEGEMNVVFDGEAQYMWGTASGNEKVGFKMSQDCLEEFKKDLKDMPTSGGTGITRPEDITEGFDLAQNVSCRPAPMADFSIPTDIVFTDQCAVMKQSLDAIKNIQLPQGIELPQGIPGMPSGY